MGLSDKYDEFYSPSLRKETLREVTVGRWPRDRLEAIVAVAGQGGTVVDIGCGNGLLLWQLRDRFSELVGVEYSPQRLAQAGINLEGHAFRPVRGSAEQMSTIDTESIDCIVSADVIEHIPDVYQAVSEMFRVLKPGGRIAINTPNIAFAKKRLLLLLGRFPSTSQPNEGIGSELLYDGGHLHYFTYRALRLILERVGFSMLTWTSFGKFGAFHALWPPLTSVGVQWLATKPR